MPFQIYLLHHFHPTKLEDTKNTVKEDCFINSVILKQELAKQVVRVAKKYKISKIINKGIPIIIRIL